MTSSMAPQIDDDVPYTGQTTRCLDTRTVKLTVFNSNYVVVGLEGRHPIPNPEPDIFKDWQVSYDGVITHIHCFIDPKFPKRAEVLRDTLRLIIGDL